MRYAVIIAAVVLAVMTVGRAAPAAEAPQMSIVDMKRIYDESKYKDEYEKRIQQMVTNAQVEVSERRQKIEAMKKDMWLLTGEHQTKKQEEIASEEKKLNDFILEARKQVDDQKRAFLDEFEGKVIAIVGEVAAAEGFSVVLNSAAVIYHKDIRDLTDAVIEKLNERFNAEHSEKGSESSGGSDSSKGSD
jgi:Skp family chaperone for outer membrane proteins